MRRSRYQVIYTKSNDLRNLPILVAALSIAWIVLGMLCSAVIVFDEVKHPQKMWVMNLVWPLTALFGSVFWVAAYYSWERNAPVSENEQNEVQPFASMVMKGTRHCGAGCTLGDIIVEWSAFAFPVLASWFGWHPVLNEKKFAVWIPDFIVAFVLGIVFQYLTIKPMRGLSVGAGVVAA